MESGKDKDKDKDKNEEELKEIYLQHKGSEYQRSSMLGDYKPGRQGVDNNVDPNTVGVPLDYSFRKVDKITDLLSGTPREYRVGVPKKAASGKYITRYDLTYPDFVPLSSSLWVNYNHLKDLRTITSFAESSLNKPNMIAWLDISFNNIDTISKELLQFQNLKILYLHGNQIKFFIEVAKLKALPKLRTLTLHGNPIEENINYRSLVIKYLPKLINFDFSLVTKD